MIRTYQVIHHLKQLARSSQGALAAVPKKGDNIPTLVIKALALSERLVTYLAGDGDVVESFFKGMGVEKKKNINFVNLYFSLLKDPTHRIKRIPMGDDHFCLVIKVPEAGTLYFIEDMYLSKWGNSGSKLCPEFCHSLDFNFGLLLTRLWAKYDNRIYVSLENKQSWEKKATFSTFPLPKASTFGPDWDRLKKLRDQNRQYRRDNISRSYLLLGDPGTGKSTFALKLAKEDEKIIKFDAQSLETLNAEGMEFLLKNLQPDLLLIDDIDNIIFSSSISTLLYILELIKSNYPNTCVLMTANDLEKMHPAMLRPGRIDEIIEFHPSADHRKAILLGYLQERNISLSKKKVEEVIKETKGMSGAYMREFVIQLKNSPYEEVLANFIRRRNLLQLGSEEASQSAEKSKKKKKKKKKEKKEKKK